MATFDNPSYFTMTSNPPETGEGDGNTKTRSKRLKGWSKLKRHFRSKLPVENGKINNHVPAESCHKKTSSFDQSELDFMKQDAVYYNFTSVTQNAINEDEINDEVFTDAASSRNNPVVIKTSNRHRRHSLGSWFRSSLSSIKRNNASSAASGLESVTIDRPSTSSEHALLAGSTSTHSVPSRSNRDLRRFETSRLHSTAESSNETGIVNSEVKKRSKSPLSFSTKSQGELRARARFVRQEKLNRDKAVSTSKIPRSVTKNSDCASLDRRYTNSTEVLTSSKSEEKHVNLNNVLEVTGQKKTILLQHRHEDGNDEQQQEKEVQQQPEGDNEIRRNDLSTREIKDGLDSDATVKSTSKKSETSSVSRLRLLQRSRTIEERHRSCGSPAATVSSRTERRRASLDVAMSSQRSCHRRRCERCRKRMFSSTSEKYDAVILFSKTCSVAVPWIQYLSDIITKIFDPKKRATRIMSRDVESLVTQSSICNRNDMSHIYQNETIAERLDADRTATQHHIRNSVASASLQIILLSKPLLNHVITNAHDPLGQLLNPARVVALYLGVESRDITELHRSALYSFSDWPKIAMKDQHEGCVKEFLRLARNIILCSEPAITSQISSQPAKFKLCPRKIRPGETRVTLNLVETEENIQTKSSISVRKGEDILEPEKITWLNPYCATFEVPKEFLERGIIVKVELKVEGLSWGIRDLKCQSRLGEIALLLKDCGKEPLDLMCQALDISPVDRVTLDETLASALVKKNIPFAEFSFSKSDWAHLNEKSDEEFPTLLHFAACFGFEQLTWELLCGPAAAEAVDIRNCYGFNALQIAKHYNNESFINCVESFRQILKLSIIENVAAQPLENEYMTMNLSTMNPMTKEGTYETIGNNEVEATNEPKQEQGATPELRRELLTGPVECNYISIVPELPPKLPSRKISPQPLINAPKPTRSCLDDLKEILDLYKKGNVSIEQAESYLENWKARPEVKKETEHKQALLMKMIAERKARIQNDSRKKETTLIKKLLGSSNSHKSEPKAANSEGNLLTKHASEPPQHCTLPLLRPPVQPRTRFDREVNNVENIPSSHSSWSSDRSSITSQLSHDSGAHFDSTEEKKVIANLPDYDDTPSLPTTLQFPSYAIPPAPRPVAVHGTDGNASSLLRNYIHNYNADCVDDNRKEILRGIQVAEEPDDHDICPMPILKQRSTEAILEQNVSEGDYIAKEDIEPVRFPETLDGRGAVSAEQLNSPPVLPPRSPIPSRQLSSSTGTLLEKTNRSSSTNLVHPAPRRHVSTRKPPPTPPKPAFLKDIMDRST